mgnify:CR=1 FL=1
MTGCFHCGEPVPTGSNFTLEIKGIVQPMCCPGCQAVAQTILECGLASYYEHRTAPGIKGELVPSELAALTHYDLAEVQQEAQREAFGRHADQAQRARQRIEAADQARQRQAFEQDADRAADGNFRGICNASNFDNP